MARVDTTKDINVAQLGVELGRVPLRAVAGEFVDAPTVAATPLRQAIDAHVPNPAWTDPNPPPAPPLSPEEAARQRLRTLKAKGWANLTAAERTEVAQRLLESLA